MNKADLSAGFWGFKRTVTHTDSKGNEVADVHKEGYCIQNCPMVPVQPEPAIKGDHATKTLKKWKSSSTPEKYLSHNGTRRVIFGYYWTMDTTTEEALAFVKFCMGCQD